MVEITKSKTLLTEVLSHITRSNSKLGSVKSLKADILPPLPVTSFDATSKTDMAYASQKVYEMVDSRPTPS
jgi:hypothetical protein